METDPVRHPISSPWIVFLISPFLLFACGKGDTPPSITSSPQVYQDPQASLTQATTDSKLLLGRKGEQYRAVWDQNSSGERWTSLALELLNAHRDRFEAARDLEEFCPGYASAKLYQKDTCWLRIFSAIAFYESTFNPKATYLEATGRTSVGLFMMAADHCPNAPTVDQLKDDSANMRCALPRMAFLIARDHYLSGPGNLGAARYWSVLRAPYRFQNLYLGRREHILQFTKNYAGFAPPSPYEIQ